MPADRRLFGSSSVVRWSVPLALAAALLSGCGSSSASEVTSTVVDTVTSTQVAVSTAVETTVSVSVAVSTTLETSTSVVVTTAAAPDADTPGPSGGPPCSTDAAYFDEAPDGLDPKLILAWRSAQSAARGAGVTLCLNDGKRSVAQQEQTFTSYVAQYGEEQARALVLPPEKSAHVAGYAIDVQPAAAYQWLEATGGKYGLCRMYDNEAWHFEYAETFTLGCPPRRSQPAG